MPPNHETGYTFLETYGFKVETATSIEEAQQYLKTRYYHLHLFAQSMGLQLLKFLEQADYFDCAETFINLPDASEATMNEYLDLYGDYQRDKTVYAGLRPVSITEQKLVQRLRGPIDRETPQMNVNLALEIEYQNKDGSPHPDLLTEIVDQLEHDVDEVPQLAEEFEELICRLLRNYERVVLRPLAPGYSGAGVLYAIPYLNKRAAAPLAVKFGDRQSIGEEHQRFLEFGPLLQDARRPTVESYARTPHLGGIVYLFLGNEGRQPIEELAALYERWTTAELRTVLDTLFTNTMSGWYDPMDTAEVDLAERYHESIKLRPDRLRRALADLPGTAIVDGRVHFDGLDESFSDPISLAGVPHIEKRPIMQCITHGDLTLRNILVNTMGSSWLIDFRHTGEHHHLRDMASLDASLRLKRLTREDADLTQRLTLEQVLMQATDFAALDQLDEEHFGSSGPLAKVYQLSLFIRKKARERCQPNPASDLDEYYIALFYYTIRAVMFDNLLPIQRQHALLSASLLADAIRGRFPVTS